MICRLWWQKCLEIRQFFMNNFQKYLHFYFIWIILRRIGCRFKTQFFKWISMKCNIVKNILNSFKEVTYFHLKEYFEFWWVVVDFILRFFFNLISLSNIVGNCVTNSAFFYKQYFSFGSCKTFAMAWKSNIIFFFSKRCIFRLSLCNYYLAMV